METKTYKFGDLKRALELELSETIDEEIETQPWQEFERKVKLHNSNPEKYEAIAEFLNNLKDE